MASGAVGYMQLIAVLLFMTFSGIISHEAQNPLQHQQAGEHEHHQQQQQFHQQPPSDGHHASGRHQPQRTMDRTSVHDDEHLREHMDGQIKAEENLSDEERQFRYFKVHDYDGNNMLDGIELIKALTHHHRREGEERRISDEELSEMITEILEDNDKNHDGYIDYAEFILSQREGK